MKHYDYEINLFIDGELVETEKQEMFIHLASCEKCRNTFEDFIRLKESTRKIIGEDISEIKNKPKRTNLFYRIGFYASTAAAIIFLFIITTSKPKETFVTKNEVRVDTVFVKPRIPEVNNQITMTHSATPGKRSVSVESSQKEYLRYVASLRTEKLTEADIIQLN